MTIIQEDNKFEISDFYLGELISFINDDEGKLPEEICIDVLGKLYHFRSKSERIQFLFGIQLGHQAAQISGPLGRKKKS